MSKSISQLESLNRELQERNRILENSKSQADKDYYQLQAVLEAERRDRGHDSEMIGDLQGNTFSHVNCMSHIICHCKFLFYSYCDVCGCMVECAMCCHGAEEYNTNTWVGWSEKNLVEVACSFHP